MKTHIAAADCHTGARGLRAGPRRRLTGGGDGESPRHTAKPEPSESGGSASPRPPTAKPDESDVLNQNGYGNHFGTKKIEYDAKTKIELGGAGMCGE